MHDILIIVDMQYDFCSEGALPHYKSLEIIPTINRIRPRFPLIVFTRDLHPNNHISFKKMGGNLPMHCVMDTHGGEICRDLIMEKTDIIISKGTLQGYDSDSIFYNANTIDKPTNLRHIIQANNITDIYLCGTGLDGVIFSSAIDSINFRYKTYIIEDAVSYNDKNKIEQCSRYLKGLGVIFIRQTEIVSTL